MSRRKNGENISGWLIVDKPRDVGSTDVVNSVRRLFNANKCGHTGTLDPFATGVLPIAFGEATKLVPYVTDGSKEYEFILRFGVETNTDDTEGEVVAVSEKIPNDEEILHILPQFIGKIKQTPPAYSAIKINGQRAYKLARQGLDVEMPEREVEVLYLEFLGRLENNLAQFRVGCSKGTYVRTLGKDIAKKLGTVGHLQELRRTKCGNFTTKDTILLEDLKNVVYKDVSEKILLPLVTCLRDIAVIAVSEADAAKLRQGQGVSPKAYDIGFGEALAVLGENPVAIVSVDERRISPMRVFNL